MAELATRTVNKVMWRLLPFLMACYFVAFLDRCIQARLPDPMPEPGQVVKLKALDAKTGWAGDFNEIANHALRARLRIVESRPLISCREESVSTRAFRTLC